MKNLDYYLNTPDELFNTNVQFWYFEFSGSKKPNTEKPFEVFAKALHEVYFFIQDNLDKPFGCIEKINNVSETNGFNEDEKFILVDKILGILSDHPESEKQEKVFFQLLYFRNSLITVIDYSVNDLLRLSSKTLDLRFDFEDNLHFDFEAIKAEFATIKTPIDKLKFLMNLYFDYLAEAPNINVFERQYYNDIGFFQWLAAELSRCEFEQTLEEITPLAKALPPQPIVENHFSVLEWATIFYYADEAKLLDKSPLKTRMEKFMSKHQINTTFDNFKTKYYEVNKRINKKKDYPIRKLELIIPFLKKNYKQTVTMVENDIYFLKEEKEEREE